MQGNKNRHKSNKNEETDEHAEETPVVVEEGSPAGRVLQLLKHHQIDAEITGTEVVAGAPGRQQLIKLEGVICKGTPVHVTFYKIHAVLTVILVGVSMTNSFYLNWRFGMTFVINGAFPLAWFIYQLITIKSRDGGNKCCPACSESLPNQPPISFCPYFGRPLTHADRNQQ